MTQYKYVSWFLLWYLKFECALYLILELWVQNIEAFYLILDYQIVYIGGA